MFTTSCSTTDSVAKSDSEFILQFKVKCNLDDASVKVVKLDPRIHTLNIDGIGKLIFDKITQDKIAIDKHGAVSNLSTHSEKINLDFIDTTSYKSKHEHGRVIRKNAAWEKWNLFELDQQIRLNAENDNFESIFNSYSFLLQSVHEKLYTNFSLINFNDSNNKSQVEELLNNPDIVWIAQVSSTINFNDIEFVEGNLEDFKNVYFEKLKRGEVPVYSIYADSNSPKLSFANFLAPRIDSVVTFDPGSFEESVLIRKYPTMNVSDISAVRLTQLICFNHESSSFISSIQSLNVLRDYEGASFELFMIK